MARTFASSSTSEQFAFCGRIMVTPTMSRRHFLFAILIYCSFLTLPCSGVVNNTGKWDGKNYPDLRGPTRTQCGAHMQLRSYLCDPDHILSRDDAVSLNIQLHELTNATSCKCQRIGQCVGEDLEGNSVEVGFIVAVAFARALIVSDLKPDMAQILQVAHEFCVKIRGRWAMGDCGNSAIVLIWEEYKLLYVLPDRETKRYLTMPEIEGIKSKVQHHIDNRDYRRALDIVLREFITEIQGDKETRTDIGQLSLIMSVAVAILFVCIITGCVCAFRCCGNLRPDGDSPMGQTFQSVDTLKSQVIKRGSMLRRSLSRSPKLPHHQTGAGGGAGGIHRFDHSAPLIHSSSSGMPSPTSAPSRQLLASLTAQQQMPKRTNMARLASPYYGADDGHSMV